MSILGQRFTAAKLVNNSMNTTRKTFMGALVSANERSPHPCTRLSTSDVWLKASYMQLTPPVKKIVPQVTCIPINPSITESYHVVGFDITD